MLENDGVWGGLALQVLSDWSSCGPAPASSCQMDLKASGTRMSGFLKEAENSDFDCNQAI